MRSYFKHLLFLTFWMLSACQTNNATPGSPSGADQGTPIAARTKPPTSTVSPSPKPSLTPTITLTPEPSPTDTPAPSPTSSPTITPDLPWYLAGKPLNAGNLNQLAVLEEWDIDDPNISFIQHLAISPDKKTLAAHVNAWAKNLGTSVKIYDIATKEIINEFHEGSEYVSDMKFSPDGSLFAIGSWGYTVKIWRTSDWKAITQLQPNSEVNSIAFSPDGKYLIVGSNVGAYYASSYQCTISVWDTRNWQMLRKEMFSKKSCVIENLVFSTDGTQFAYSMGANLAQIRNLEDLGLVAELTEPKSGYSSSLNFSSDGTALFVHIFDRASLESKVLEWDYVNGAIIEELAPLGSNFVDNIQVLIDPAIVMVINENSLPDSPNISFWNEADGAHILDFMPMEGLGEEALRIDSSFLSNDKSLLALGLESEAVGGEESGSVAIKKIVFYGAR